MKDIMLLESALAELSIDILDDHQPQILEVITTPAAASHAYNYTQRVVIEMYSPSESSSELLKSSGKPIARHGGKEDRQRKNMHAMVHLSEDEAEKYSWYRAPCSVPFTWEIQPGVPKPLQIRESELRDDDEHQSSRPAPLKLPPNSSNSTYSTASSAPLKKNAEGCFRWNLNHSPTQSINVHEGRNFNGYDGDEDEEDIIPSKFELDSNEEWSPMSTLGLPQSPRSLSLIPPANSNGDHLFQNDKGELTRVPSGAGRSTCTTLLWGILPCKCIFVPWLKHKGKIKQSVWATGHQRRQDSNTTDGVKILMEASQPVRSPSALNIKSSRSGSCKRNCCNSGAKMKQVRFSVETDAYFSSSSSNEEEGTLPPPNLIDWASYGLF